MGKPPSDDRAAPEPVGMPGKAKLRDERGPGVWLAAFKLDQETDRM